MVVETNRSYNLFGDPAMRIRRPLPLTGVGFADILRPGHTARLDLRLPPGMQNGIAVVTLERPLGAGELEPTDDPSLTAVERSARLQRNFRLYNERVAATMRVEIRDGRPVRPVDLPANIVPGRYLLRVAVMGETDVATAVVEDYPVENETPTEWLGGL